MKVEAEAHCYGAKVKALSRSTTLPIATAKFYVEKGAHSTERTLASGGYWLRHLGSQRAGLVEKVNNDIIDTDAAC